MSAPETDAPGGHAPSGHPLDLAAAASLDGDDGDRGFVVGEEDRGTPASTWQAWRPDLPELAFDDWRRVVVIAAHPDDDVLGVGGLLARLADRGTEVIGVQLTDGTAAYPDSPTLSPSELGRVRVAEARRAYARLGLAPPLRCELQDGRLGEHEDAIAERLRPLFRPGDRWLVPWRHDQHPDHEAAGRAAARVCTRSAGGELWEYPVWMWHWAHPTGSGLGWDSAYLHHLTPAQRDHKRRAACEFRSQLRPLSPHPADAPVVPPFAFERLVSPRELVFRG
ncbi:PIG-L deacetylase family protein [Granulicoccus sp. GXG6511]|uniref:PIG-L deacetylase family protein n=1 Tax=Granulicoccus sp. GXG6511 TaxID=3381351 RepID=UPI003D7C7FDB